MRTVLSPEILSLVSINFLIVLSLWIPLYAGVLSLGLAGFMVVGGLVSGYLSTHGASLVVAILAGVASAAALGVGPALLALRVKTLYLAIATLAFAELTLVVVSDMEVLGGVQGLSGFEPVGAPTLFIVAGTALVLALVFYRSRAARVCEAVADDPFAAASCGISAAKYQMVMTIVGAAISGLAGALYAHYYGYVGPSSFGFPTVVRSLIFLIVGGLTPVGAFIGAAIFTLLPQYLHFLEGWMDALYAGIVILLLIFLPQGLVPKKMLSWFLLRRRDALVSSVASDLESGTAARRPVTSGASQGNGE